MIVEVRVPIAAPRAAAWAAMTDIENAARLIQGIDAVEIVDRPTTGLVGLRWRETRMLFGKPATAEKWITDATEHESYRTRAEDGGYVFVSTTRIVEGTGGLTLVSVHETIPQTFVARLMTVPMRLFFRGVMVKALEADLRDIKAAAEGNLPA